MIFDIFWNSFVSYPDKLNYYDEVTQVEDKITDKTEMDKFVRDNAEKEVANFTVNFDTSSVWVVLAGKE